MKKILIVGAGPMGIAHLKSFLNHHQRYEIFISDLRMNEIKVKNLNLFKKFKNINISKNLPKNLTLDLAIISTNSKERYSIIKDILKYNKIKNLLLEKFIFSNLKIFYLFEKLIIKKGLKNIFVNSWGEYISKKLKINEHLKNNKKLKVKININKGGMLTNLIHYLDFVSQFLKKNKFQLIEKRVSIINSKRKKYNELDGVLNIEMGSNTISFNSNFKKNFQTIEITDNYINYLIEINRQGNCNLYKNKKLLKRIPFPFASEKTEQWYRNFTEKKNKERFKNNYKKIAYLSKQILIVLKGIDKKISIT